MGTFDNNNDADDTDDMDDTDDIFGQGPSLIDGRVITS